MAKPPVLPYADRPYTFPLARTPLPSGAADADCWHPAGGGYCRFFRSKPFPVFEGLTVHTGGLQIVLDGDQPPETLRTITVTINRAHLAGYQAREIARALIEAADYISGMDPVADDGEVRAATVAETPAGPLEADPYRTRHSVAPPIGESTAYDPPFQAMSMNSS